jgi:transposase InsO family protein
VTVTEAMTDNGSCCRRRLFDGTLGDIIHRSTRLYRPQTNGKVERFNHTKLEELAYVRPFESEAERVGTFEDFLHLYNRHQGHITLGGKPPISRVNDLRGQYN